MADKRKAIIEETNKQLKKKKLENMLTSVATNSRGSDDRVASFESNGGFFIEDDHKFSIAKLALEKMPGLIRDVAKSVVSKDFEVIQNYASEFENKIEKNVNLKLSPQVLREKDI